VCGTQARRQRSMASPGGGHMLVAQHIMSASTTGGPASQRHLAAIAAPAITAEGLQHGATLPPPEGLPSRRFLSRASWLEQLPVEALEMIFTRLDHGRDLQVRRPAQQPVPSRVGPAVLTAHCCVAPQQATASCSKKLRLVATSDGFWQAAVTRRWHIHKVVNPRLLRDPDGFGWLRLYTNWERTLRLPTCVSTAASRPLRSTGHAVLHPADACPTRSQDLQLHSPMREA
jgi:hypothetical protein